ncbi:aspartyl/asparaginyl beta-hydroxylase domain-containing protein [Streptomyces sp. NPDC054796]
MARTQRVGHVEIDESAVRTDLEAASQLVFSEAYSDYLCGGPWKSLMVWSSDGNSGDGLITNYEHGKRSSVTKYGEQLPYVRNLIESNFNTEHLNFARLAVMSDSVTMPHRDLLELSDIPEEVRNTNRVHVPLVTTEEAFFTQANDVYRMHVGEVWFFDASRVHSAGALSPEPRTHLILDFCWVEDESELVRFDFRPTGGIPRERIRERAPLTGKEREEILALAPVIDADNIRDVFGIVIKKHYRKDGGDNFIWDTLDELGRRSQDENVRAKIQELHRFFLMERSA